LAVASFLPLDEPSSSLAGVRSNTLIQHGEWWLLIGGAVVVVAALRSYTSGRRQEATSVIVLGAIAAVLVVYFGQDKALRTLYPLDGGWALRAEPAFSNGCCELFHAGTIDGDARSVEWTRTGVTVVWETVP
jgi:hypothetical protein